MSCEGSKKVTSDLSSTASTTIRANSVKIGAVDIEIGLVDLTEIVNTYKI